MLYGITESGEKITPRPNLKSFCPTCGSELIAKCGEYKVWHWAHKSLNDCDNWSERETEWHRSAKELFPVEWREVTVEKNGIKHRADVLLPNGTVIEFQHSPISPVEMEKRETFYKKMVWVFDICDIDFSECLETEIKEWFNYQWKFPKKYMLNRPSNIPIYFSQSLITKNSPLLLMLDRVKLNTGGYGLYLESIDITYSLKNLNSFFNEANIKIKQREDTIKEYMINSLKQIDNLKNEIHFLKKQINDVYMEINKKLF